MRKSPQGFHKQVLALAVFAVLGEPALGTGVVVTTKTLKDATHIELSGLNEWRYDVSRKKIDDRTHVVVHISGVKPVEIQALRTLRDNRVTGVEVKEGLNGDASIEFVLADHKLGFFDYQTEAPASLILDIYKEDLEKPAKTTTTQKKQLSKKQEILASLVEKSTAHNPGEKSRKSGGRNIASVDHPEIGSQPLLASNGDSSRLQLKYGIFDGGDQNLTRFKIDDKDISEKALIKSERNMYLHFPMLSFNKPYLKNILAETPNYAIDPVESEENQQVRLVVKLFNEGKYAVALRTMKFFYEKFPETTYQKTLDFVTAEIYLKLWQRDHNRIDFDAAMTRFKDILNKYPQDPSRFRTLMLVGMNYMDIGNNLGALSTFEVGTKTQPDSPHFWQMRMEVAEALNNLNKDKSSLKELEEIETSPLSKDYAVEARYRRGDVFFHAKDYANAVNEYHTALTKFPDKWTQGPNLYFNAGEAQFWLKNYKEALSEFREFLQRFPTHPYGGYAMTRIGEILGILGASEQKYEGAFLESYFRYRGSPGAYVAKVHINTSRFGTMKEKELVAARNEISSELPNINIPEIDTFVTLNEADGFTSRKEFEVSNDMLIKYYQSNILSPHLPLFKHRIVQNITGQMERFNQKKEHMKALETFIHNEDSWLQKNERIDTRFVAGQAYEALNVPVEATNFYEQCLKTYTTYTPDQLKHESVYEKLPTPDEINLRLAKVSLKNDEVKKAATYLGNIKEISKLSEAEQVERSLILSSVAEKEEKPDLAILALKDLTEHWNVLGDASAGRDVLLAEPWMRIARINANLKKYSEALPWVEKVVKVAKSNPTGVSHDIAREALEMAADLYVKTGDSRSAIDSYKLYLEKFADQVPVASLKYKLGKLYFDQKRFREASQVWDSLKNETGGDLWNKMAKEQLAQAHWDEKYDRYISRKPAGGNK